MRGQYVEMVIDHPVEASVVYFDILFVLTRIGPLGPGQHGNKVSEVNGIRAGCKVMKTRYAKPFEGVQVKIPYTTGTPKYTRLFVT